MTATEIFKQPQQWKDVDEVARKFVASYSFKNQMHDKSALTLNIPTIYTRNTEQGEQKMNDFTKLLAEYVSQCIDAIQTEYEKATEQIYKDDENIKSLLELLHNSHLYNECELNGNTLLDTYEKQHWCTEETYQKIMQLENHYTDARKQVYNKRDTITHILEATREEDSMLRMDILRKQKVIDSDYNFIIPSYNLVK